MNAELKAAWLEALRSDKYRHGKHRLCTITGDGKEYCCLGVLCEVAASKGFNIKSSAPIRNGDAPYDYLRFEYNGASSYAELPHYFQDDIAISEEVESNLICMNDSTNDGKSFKEIADYIEKTL